MTEEEARDYCETYMDSSSAFVACKGVPSVPTDASLEICQIDILVRSICYVNRVTLQYFDRHHLQWRFIFGLLNDLSEALFSLFLS